VTAAPPELRALRERMAELSDLGAVGSLLSWDQQTVMPPAGAAARAEHAATIDRIHHEKLVDPEVGRLLDSLERWTADQDPDSDEVRLVRWARRDHEKAVRVPSALAAEIGHAGAAGQQTWEEARAASDFGLLRDVLARQLELRHRYIACFDGYAHPYDALLDDFEPELTTAELAPLFESLREELVPLVAACGDPGQARNGGVFNGTLSVERQRQTMLRVLEDLGFDPRAWRLDAVQHPFADSLSIRDVRITTHYDEADFGVTFYAVLHEFGHGLYEAGIAPEFERTPLAWLSSMGAHESQSRLWENIVGRSRPFCAWVLPRLKELLPGALDGLDVDRLYHGANTVQPSPIRVLADETTYNLHVVLRFELELALIEGTLTVDDLPHAWNEGMERLLGVEIRDDAQGVLQDVHWPCGLWGYFPTYAIGNLMAAQLWERAVADLHDLEDAIERGDFAPLRGWLGEHVHRHGRKFASRELLRRITGEDPRMEPFLRYLRAKLEDSGVLAARLP
jgi:carboxypeptidase Taq